MGYGVWGMDGPPGALHRSGYAAWTLSQSPAWSAKAEIMREASRWQMWPAPGQASCAPSAKTHSSKSVHQFSWWMTELRAFCEGGEGFSVGSANRERSAGMRSAVERPWAEFEADLAVEVVVLLPVRAQLGVARCDAVAARTQAVILSGKFREEGEGAGGEVKGRYVAG